MTFKFSPFIISLMWPSVTGSYTYYTYLHMFTHITHIYTCLHILHIFTHVYTYYTYLHMFTHHFHICYNGNMMTLWKYGGLMETWWPYEYILHLGYNYALSAGN